MKTLPGPYSKTIIRDSSGSVEGKPLSKTLVQSLGGVTYPQGKLLIFSDDKHLVFSDAKVCYLS